MGTVALPSVSERPVFNNRNKEKGLSPTGRKKTPTYGTAHLPTTDDADPTPTHRPNLYYIQQYSSAAVRTAAVHLVRGEELVG